MNVDDIKYFALSELGIVERPDFLNTDDNAVKIINEQYDFILSLALQKYPWGFATKQTEITDVTTLTDEKYDYKYLIPEDCLFIRGRYSNNTYSGIVYDYQDISGYIYTNSTELFIEYTAQVCEGSLPYYFINYLKYLIARITCLAITGDNDLLQVLYANEDKEFKEAKNADIMQKPVRILDTGVFIDVRN